MVRAEMAVVIRGWSGVARGAYAAAYQCTNHVHAGSCIRRHRHYYVFACRYTFVEGVQNPHSVTILIKGPSDHVIAQIKDAVRDGLRAVKNTIDDGAVVPGK